MAKSLRFDAGTLRSPVTTSQGFLRVDGRASRTGVLEYVNGDGTIRRELRLPEEVFRADVLAQFEGVPLTDGHPPEMVTVGNAAKYTRGSVTAAARQDGEFTATTIVVTDPTLIRKIRAGATGLSVGYAVDLDETPGVHPKYGRYDAIQRNLTINHLAAAVTPRAGEAARVRMDGLSVFVQRADADARMLTTAALGHQHLLCSEYDGIPSAGGPTSWAIAEGADSGHDHPWVRNTDGTFSIGEAAGHTHQLLSTDRYSARADGQIDQLTPRSELGLMADTMSQDEQIRALKLQLEEATQKLSLRTDAAAAVVRERDAANGRLRTLEDRITLLEGQIAAGATAVETAAVRAQAQRADAAEATLSELKAGREASIRAAAELRLKVVAVMPEGFRCDGKTDRELQCLAIRKFSPKEPVGADVSDAYIAARFDSLAEAYMGNARSLTRVGELSSPTPNKPSREARASAWRDQALNPDGYKPTI